MTVDIPLPDWLHVPTEMPQFSLFQVMILVLIAIAIYAVIVRRKAGRQFGEDQVDFVVGKVEEVFKNKHKEEIAQARTGAITDIAAAGSRVVQRVEAAAPGPLTSLETLAGADAGKYSTEAGVPLPAAAAAERASVGPARGIGAPAPQPGPPPVDANGAPVAPSAPPYVPGGFQVDPVVLPGAPNTVSLPRTGHVLSAPRPEEGLLAYALRVHAQAGGDFKTVAGLGATTSSLSSYGPTPDSWPAMVDEYYNTRAYMTPEELAKQEIAAQGWAGVYARMAEQANSTRR